MAFFAAVRPELTFVASAAKDQCSVFSFYSIIR